MVYIVYGAKNETADGLRTKSVGSEPYLPLSLSRYKSKIKNWIERRKQVAMETQ